MPSDWRHPSPRVGENGVIDNDTQMLRQFQRNKAAGADEPLAAAGSRRSEAAAGGNTGPVNA